MQYKKLLTIQDISCVGQCSLTVALPILSACGVETCILPSAVLSTHTSGFKNYTFRDLTEDMPLIKKHWISEGITFDAIYTGYLGSAKQIDYVKDFIKETLNPSGITVIDPAMADCGKLYPGFDLDFVQKMKSLCENADYLVPNITEACLLTGIPYCENYDESYITEICVALASLGAKTIVLTGVSYDPSFTGVVVYDGKIRYYKHKRINRGCHGTGDVYASAFTGALLNGINPFDAARIAANYTVRCIENTITDTTHWYGVKFETALSSLIEEIKSESK